MVRVDARPRLPRRGRLLLPILLAPLIGPCACRSAPDATPSSPQRRQFEVLADADEVEVGVEVRVTIRSTDALPDASDVHWIASGGELVASDAGRSARVRFDEPGEYRVSATLFDRDRIVDTHTVRISVRPAPGR